MPVSFSDVTTAVSLAWKLYHDCWMVAYEAPEGFRLLVTELSSAQSILTRLREQTNDASFLESAGEQRQEHLHFEAERMKQTLKALEKLVSKFYKLGRVNSAKEFWTHRVRWVFHQGDIEMFQKRIMAHNCMLSLAMTAVGNITLLDIQKRLDTALAQQPSGMPIDTNLETITPPESDRQFSPNDSGLTRHKSISTVETDLTQFSFASHGGSSISEFSTHDTISRPAPEEVALDSPDINTVIGDAHKVLLKCNEQVVGEPAEPKSAPVFDPPHPDCVIDPVTAQRFETAARLQRRQSNISLEEWLRNATWWLVKSRTIFTLHMQGAGFDSPAIRENSIATAILGQEQEMSLELGLENLKKASWIVYGVVLKNEEMVSTLTDANLKALLSLISALRTDFSTAYHYLEMQSEVAPVRRPDATGTDPGLEDNGGRQLGPTRIWEPLCVFEQLLERKRQLPAPEHLRWIAVEQKDAGLAGEHVLYRSFVNAEIGGRRVRNVTVGAPYMLLLHVEDGQSELKVTLSSQRGFINISRDFTRHDLDNAQKLLAQLKLLPKRRMRRLEPLSLHSSVEIDVEFLLLEDLEGFIRIPQKFFDTVSLREKKSDAETLLFRTVIEESAIVNALNTNSRRSPSKFCELRVYEKCEQIEDGWMRSRRLVLSSSPKEDPPWCRSTFLPVGGVYINQDPKDDKRILIKFSDCNHQKKLTQPDHTHLWSRIYNQWRPNRCVSLIFATSKDTQEFKDIALNLKPQCLWTSSHQETERKTIYAVSSRNPEDGLPKAVQVTKKVDDWQYSTLFFVPKVVDFIIESEHSMPRIRLPKVFSTDYISDHSEKYDDIDERKRIAEFKECKKKYEPQELIFSTFGDLQLLLRSLTSNWTLKDLRTVKKAKYEEPGTRRFLKSGKIVGQKFGAQIFIWEKGDKKRIVVRWDGMSGDCWMTTSLHTRTHCKLPPSGRDSITALIPDLNIIHGKSIDLGSMSAVDPVNQSSGIVKKGILLNVQFLSCREKEKFAEAAGLSCP